MLCSVPAGKSAGGSNWLSRLRSNKGFPAGEDGDLDHFLAQNPNSSTSESTQRNPHRIAVADRLEAPPQIGGRVEQEWIGVMDNVLSELFFMGGADEISSSRLSGKRIPRKQTNPRICVTSASNNNNSGNSNSSVVVSQKKKKGSDSGPKTASLSSDSGGNTMREANVNVGVDVDVNDEDEDEKELKGYSRSEVTVIDTSCGSWKSEKLVFRRKSVWRVREKKGKVRSFGRKKRKSGTDEYDYGMEKKAKLVPSDHSQEANAHLQSSTNPSSHEEQNLKNDSREEVRKGTADNNNTMREVGTDSPDNISQDFKKRSRLVSGSLKKMKKGGSSVVLIKGIPTDKKNAAKLSSNCPKSTQKQNKT